MSSSVTTLSKQEPLSEDTQLGNRIAFPSRKRKAVEDDIENGLGDSIAIRPYSEATGLIRRLTPKQIIPRSILPLAYISSANVSYPSLFLAYIWCLESKNRGSQDELILLIAQDQDETLVAIERVAKGVYAICRLAEWVRLDDFGRSAAKLPRFEAQTKVINSIKKNSWWSAAAIVAPLKNEKTTTRLVDFVLADRPETVSGTIKISPRKIEPTLVKAAPVVSKDVQPPVQELDTIDWSVSLRQHYLEALYTSRAPLAYFVKGPLSRSRVAHQGNEAQLSKILRSSILSIKARSNAAVIDKKYNKGIIDVLAEIPSGISAEESSGVVGLSQERISKSRRRKKISADGLLPGEEEYIINWWVKREASSAHEGHENIREKRMKSAITEQKIREAQLQIILILEAMSLERQVQAIHSSVTQTDDTETHADSEKQKKPQDLPRTLEILVEKLQIWETMSEDIVAISSASKPSKDSNSCLQSFCLDIVLPFYASRLGDTSKMLCQKFAVVVSPEKKASRSAKTHARPGEPVLHRRNHRPLDRVLTNERVPSKRKHPSLTRAATDSLLPTIKQEFEEVDLANIALQRQSTYSSKLFSRREVDLTAEAKATEAKLKRKTEVEKELKGAIFALKKPNARLAVKEFVDASDQRNTNKSKSRKPLNPTRNPFATGVQVTATPKINRYRPRNELVPTEAQEQDVELVPTSSLPRIPSSSAKTATSHLGVPAHSLITATPSKIIKNKAMTSLIGDTPIRCGSECAKNQVLVALMEDCESEPDLPPLKTSTMGSKKPLLDVSLQSDLISVTPSKSNSFKTLSSPSADAQDAIFTTPQRTFNDTGEAALDSSPLKMRKLTATQPVVTSAPVETAKDTSIYDALGWDDDYDI